MSVLLYLSCSGERRNVSVLLYLSCSGERRNVSVAMFKLFW